MHASMTVIDETLLREWPLPLPSDDGDKETRGRVLIIGGSSEIPGAVLLAATAALRAGAGKLAVATGESVAQAIAIALPEARVIALPETPEKSVAPDAFQALATVAGKTDAVLIGPGMQNEAMVAGFVRSLLPSLGATPLILDACAMGVVGGPAADHDMPLKHFDGPVLLTPHAGEMAHLTGDSKETILADPAAAAAQAARRWGVSVALKGATTMIAAPDGKMWRHDGGNIGLAVSGSGDTLAGIMAGLTARGARLEQAAAWGVALHARAGAALAARFGQVGYLAREIPAEIPALMHALGRQ